MNREEPTSEEQLNAFLDAQLDDDERGAMLAAIGRDKELAARLCELRQIKDLVTLAYRDPPPPGGYTIPSQHRRGLRFPLAAAATLLVAVGGVGGWFSHEELSSPPPLLPIQEFAQFDPASAIGTKIILHISTMDPQRVEPALKAAEQMLDNHSKGHAVQLEIIANAEGLGILRQSSPYAKRIKAIIAEHKNVSFLACGISKAITKLTEGTQVKLIPEARVVPAALEQILSRLQQGWLYIKA